MLELTYSLYLGSDKNRKNVSRARAKWDYFFIK